MWRYYRSYRPELDSHFLTVEDALKDAAAAGLEDCTVIGVLPGGGLYHASTHSSQADFVFWLEKAKLHVMDMD